MTFITLLTDFGLQDEYVGVMKGVILGIAPQAQIVDLTHAIPAQDILQGALALQRAASYFPPGTVHLAVVDPGVGTPRRPLAARLGAYFFVGPDNGLLTPLLAQSEAQAGAVYYVHLDRPEYWLAQVSRSFHGRDIFAPVAAHLANGVPLLALGTSIHNPVRLEIPLPRRMPWGWEASVIHIDRFGNLATDLRREHIAAQQVLRIRILGAEIQGLSVAYGDRQPGELAALIDSGGWLSIALVNGSAAERLGATVGCKVDILETPD